MLVRISNLYQTEPSIVIWHYDLAQVTFDYFVSGAVVSTRRRVIPPIQSQNGAVFLPNEARLPCYHTRKR